MAASKVHDGYGNILGSCQDDKRPCRTPDAHPFLLEEMLDKLKY